MNLKSPSRFSSLLYTIFLFFCSKLRFLSMIKPCNWWCDIWVIFVVLSHSCKLAVSTWSLCGNLFPVTSNALVSSVLKYSVFSVDRFSIFSKSLARALVKEVILFQFALKGRVVLQAYISVVELFKCKGISFTNRRNITGPRINPCSTPWQMTDFGFGCYMPYFHKRLSPI